MSAHACAKGCLRLFSRLPEKALEKPKDACNGHALSSACLPCEYGSRYAELLRTVARPYDSSQLHDWLPAFVESAKIVGIGEGTHGTEEFFRVQADITKQLITYSQARLVLLELPMAYGLYAEEFLHHPAEKLLHFIHSHPFVTWHNAAISDLLGFIRTWNLQHPDDRVLFVGIDPQNDGCLPLLMNYMKDHGEPVAGLRAWCIQAAVVAAKLKTTLPGTQQATGVQTQPPLSMSDAQVLLKLAHELSSQAVQFQQALFDRETLERALRFATKHLQFSARSFQSDQLTRSDVRDELMAETILDETSRLAPEQRAVVLAHSAHVSYGAPGVFSYGMGYHVRRAVGDANYSVLVTATGGGSTRSLAHASAARREIFVAEPPPAVSLERLLHEPCDRTPKLFDIKEARSNPELSELLANPIRFRSTGSLVYRNEFTIIRPVEQFDGLIYFPFATGAAEPPEVLVEPA